MSYYSKLPDKQVKLLDKAYKKYKNPKAAKKRHEEEFNTQINKYFYQANEEFYNGKNKHFNFVLDNQKYDYDYTFSYLEKEDNLLILKTYFKEYLKEITYFDLNEKASYSYYSVYFKRTGVHMMVDPGTKYTLGAYDGWYSIYYNAQRLRDEESITILKSLDRFKYLPLEKFDKINYYLLLQASTKMINHYEILLKMGATKAATGLLLAGRTLDKVYFRKLKKELKSNRSYSYISDKISELDRIEQDREHRKYLILERKRKKLDLEAGLYQLNNLHRGYWEFDNYIVKLPDNLEEVKLEARELSHCLDSNKEHYIGGMILGQKIILFLRKKEEPEQPFYTVEIVGENISQVRSVNNSTNEEISNVVNDWFNSNKKEILQLYN